MAHLLPLEGYLDQIRVPREVLRRLERYAEILVKTNDQMNLVASSTIPELWRRHFWDSVQLLPLIPRGSRSLVDLGSGAGFPGLVLAILGVPEVHLVESVGKKVKFLEEVAAEVAPHVTIHHARAESIRGLQTDIITARAVTALPELLSLAKPFFKKESVGLFLKGEKVEGELTEARKYWTFILEKKQSLTDKSGTILVMKNLKVQRPHEFDRRAK
jgi:16S rRNA (guanine527-N7)-methyltransferase